MESRYTVHIAPAEWRWTIFVATALVLIGFAPFIWVAVADTGNWQFMGALHNYNDAATYFAKMAQGVNGQWMITFLHTPETHSGALLMPVYPLLGHVSRLISVPTIIMFHVARVGAALLMYLALYTLAASIWQRVRTRRTFFAVAAVGSGLGWLFAPLLGSTGDEYWPDLQIPEAFPFYSTLVNVHFPLTLACLALLASLIVTAFRPGADGQRDVGRLLPVASLLAVVLTFIYPQSLVPFAVALAICVIANSLGKRRQAAPWLLRWALAVVLPALPMAVYYYFVVTENGAFVEWSRQNLTFAPAPHVFLLGFGIPLLLGIPALTRAARRFEQSDDRLMLLWLVAIIICVYLPTGIQRRFMVGAMIPVAYFATRALEEFWLRRVSRPMRTLALTVLVPVIAVSHLLVLFLPVLPAVTGARAPQAGVLLERDYALVFRWLEDRTGQNDVVLASPAASIWLPGWAVARVVYGHPYETLNADAKRAEVEAWYSGQTGDCMGLIERFDVRYVLVGPAERMLGAATCAEALRPIVALGQVTIYAP